MTDDEKAALPAIAAELDKRIREHKRVLALMAPLERILPIQGPIEYAARRVALVETAREYGLADA